MIARAALAASLAWAAVHAAAAETPGDALRRIYAPYLQADSHVWPTGPRALTIFDAQLVRLLRQDRRDHPGEVGALDADPVCACQDFGRLTGLSVQTMPARHGRVLAVVRFFNEEMRETLRYDLVPTSAGWRVADIVAADGPGLVAVLRGVVSSSLAATAPVAPDTPAAFIRRLYAATLDPRRARPGAENLWAIFDIHLAARIAQNDGEDKKRAQGGLDRDPICACRTVGRLTGWSVTIQPAATGHVAAVVSFANDMTPVRVIYDLVSTRDGWRVADIGSSDVRSLSAELQRVDGPPAALLLEAMREKLP